MSNYDRLIQWLENQIGNPTETHLANFEMSPAYEGESHRWVSNENEADGNLIITLEDSESTLMLFDFTGNGVLNYKVQIEFTATPWEVTKATLDAAVNRHSFRS